MKLFIILLISFTLNQAFAEMTAQSYLEEKIAKKEIDPKKLRQTFEFNSKKYKVSDFDNVVGSNLNESFKAFNLAEAKQYAQNYIVAKSYVLKSKTESLQKKKVLENLNRMFAFIYGEDSEDELEKILQCQPEDTTLRPIQDIVRVMQDSIKSEGCRELKKGEHKVFVRDDPYTSGHYLLRKDALGNYQAIVNVDFIQSNGSVSAPAMLARAKSCLASASLAMKGPNGEKLQLSVLSPSEIENLPESQRPAKRTVKIEGPGFQTDAENYNEKIGCATITHEILHLLGLCDEYKEDREKYKDLGWNCRVVTKVPSIMKDLSVYDQAVPKKLTCECTSPLCKAAMESGKEDIKSIFLLNDIQNIAPYDFRIEYCQIITLGVVQGNSSTRPYEATSSTNGFLIEGKEVGASSYAPYYTVYKKNLTCNCPPSDKACINQKNEIFKKLKSAPINKCPSTTKEIKSELADSGLNTNLQYKNNEISFNTTPALPSLLQPAHFNKILHGNCPGVADKYNECAKHAYASDKSGCNVPAHCNDDNYYLGAPQ